MLIAARSSRDFACCAQTYRRFRNAAIYVVRAKTNDLTVMSPCDAVDGSSTRHESAKDVGAVEAPGARLDRR